MWYRTRGNFCGMKFSLLYAKPGFSQIYFHGSRTSVFRNFRGSVMVKVLVIFFALDTHHENSNCCKLQNFHGFYFHGGCFNREILEIYVPQKFLHVRYIIGASLSKPHTSESPTHFSCSRPCANN